MVKDRLVTCKTGNDPRLYLQRGNKKHWVINHSVLVDLGFQWESIEHIRDKDIEKLNTEIPITSINQSIFEFPDFIYCIEDTWSDDRATGISGWAVGKKQSIEKLSIEIDGQKKEVKHWTDQPEIFDYFSNHTSYSAQIKCGFKVVLPKKV